MTTTLRDRIVAAASRRTVAGGWSDVTMGRVAADVGVSRQTVHSEVGTKNDLAEALVLAELVGFVEQAEDAFATHPDDVVMALRAALTAVLVHAEQSPLLRAVISATHGADTDLLPLLTTQPEGLLHNAYAASMEMVGRYPLPLPPARVEQVVEMLVRSVLSHVMYPTSPPEETAEHLTWVVAQVLHAQDAHAPAG